MIFREVQEILIVSGFYRIEKTLKRYLFRCLKIVYCEVAQKLVFVTKVLTTEVFQARYFVR
jgi:hypothetical protein